MRVRRKKGGWKKLWWEIRYQIACWSLRGLIIVIRFFPLKWALFIIERIVGRIGWHLAGEYRKKMLDNLTLSFQDPLTEQEKRRISQESFRYMIRGFVETMYCVHFYKKKLYPRIELEGRENLDQALAQGKGVIAVSAHLGNFAILGAKLNASGYPFSLIINDPAHPGLARLFQEMQERVGVRSIPVDPPLRCQREIMRSLRKGEIVGFISDENQKRGGVLVEFLGRVMAMPAGPAIYHLKTGGPILPIFILHQVDGGHKVIIDTPLKVELSGDEERDIFTITAQVTRVIESYIKKYPTQWSWISKRRIRTKTRRKTFLEEKGIPPS